MGKKDAAQTATSVAGGVVSVLSDAYGNWEFEKEDPSDIFWIRRLRMHADSVQSVSFPCSTHKRIRIQIHLLDLDL
jgi:hypothetical protein